MVNLICTDCKLGFSGNYGEPCPYCDAETKEAGLAEVVDATDLKSVDLGHVGSIPAARTICQCTEDKTCVWCISSDKNEPTLEEVLKCMKGEFI